jgi:hypothetical protein
MDVILSVGRELRVEGEPQQSLLAAAAGSVQHREHRGIRLHPVSALTPHGDDAPGLLQHDMGAVLAGILDELQRPVEHHAAEVVAEGHVIGYGLGVCCAPPENGEQGKREHRKRAKAGGIAHDGSSVGKGHKPAEGFRRSGG